MKNEKDMDYGKLGSDLEKLEKIEEKREESVAVESSASGSDGNKTALKDMTEGQKASARVVTTLCRKAVCKGIANGASRYLGWKMEGYTERVDKDPVVVDAFHAMAEKRIPNIVVNSPEIATVIGLGSHAYATHHANTYAVKTETDATPEPAVTVKIEEDTIEYASEQDFPIDISVHDTSAPKFNAPDTTLNVDDFGFKNQEGEFVEAPKSIMDGNVTGIKRYVTASYPNLKNPPRKRRNVNNDSSTSIPTSNEKD